MKEDLNRRITKDKDKKVKIYRFQTQVLTYAENKKFWEELIAYFPLI
jgi:hypothetical protein